MTSRTMDIGASERFPGTAGWRGAVQCVIACDELPLAGRHNELNIQAAFALLENDLVFRWRNS